MIRSTTCPWAGTFPAADDIIYCDLTLREGEQSPGVSYTREEKFELVRKLDDLGIGQIQLTAASPDRHSLQIRNAGQRRAPDGSVRGMATGCGKIECLRRTALIH